MLCAAADRYFKTVPKSLFCLSGILGHPCQAYVFMGPIYYQKLKHMVGILFFMLFLFYLSLNKGFMHEL
jgi:hypothetical protein